MTISFRPGWARRLRALHEHQSTKDLSAMVISSPINLRYLTGFEGSSGLLVSTATRNLFVTDGRYDVAVREAVEAGAMAEVEVDRVELRYELTLIEVLRRLKAKRVGFEAGHVTVATLDSWKRGAPEVDWISTDGVVERQRLVKDAEEIQILRRAGRGLAAVSLRLREWVSADRTEREVARDIDAGIEAAGFSAPAFPTIVASGPNGAHPHARPGDRRLRGGDLVVLDFGGVLDGYCVDLTRMAGIGHVGSDATALVTAVRAAQQAAISAVQP